MAQKQRILKPAEELFCQYYVTPGSDEFSNATRSYGKAFGKDLTNKKQYGVCEAMGSTLLGKLIIRDRIREIQNPLLFKLQRERDRALGLMGKKITKAKYRDLVDGVDKTIKNEQLITGKPTQNLSFQLDETERAQLDELLKRNQ